MHDAQVLADTRRFVERIVIGLELCPFAAASLEQGGLAIRVSRAADPESLVHDLVDEFRNLEAETASAIESSLVVHPAALRDFADYNAFLGVCDRLLADLGLVGIYQIASFHPDYRFEATASDDAANYSNRSPYPMLHILRESVVARALERHPDPTAIPARNVARLRKLGAATLQALLEIESDGEPR